MRTSGERSYRHLFRRLTALSLIAVLGLAGATSAQEAADKAKAKELLLKKKHELLSKKTIEKKKLAEKKAIQGQTKPLGYT